MAETANLADEKSADQPASQPGELRKNKSNNAINSVTDGSNADGAAILSDDPNGETVEFVRPFEKLAELPDDVTEAFESFKLAILRHKMEGWNESLAR